MVPRRSRVEQRLVVLEGRAGRVDRGRRSSARAAASRVTWRATGGLGRGESRPHPLELDHHTQALAS